MGVRRTDGRTHSAKGTRSDCGGRGRRGTCHSHTHGRKHAHIITRAPAVFFARDVVYNHTGRRTRPVDCYKSDLFGNDTHGARFSLRPALETGRVCRSHRPEFTVRPRVTYRLPSPAATPSHQLVDRSTAVRDICVVLRFTRPPRYCPINVLGGRTGIRYNGRGETSRRVLISIIVPRRIMSKNRTEVKVELKMCSNTIKRRNDERLKKNKRLRLRSVETAKSAGCDEIVIFRENDYFF